MDMGTRKPSRHSNLNMELLVDIHVEFSVKASSLRSTVLVSPSSAKRVAVSQSQLNVYATHPKAQKYADAAVDQTETSLCPSSISARNIQEQFAKLVELLMPSQFNS